MTSPFTEPSINGEPTRPVVFTPLSDSEFAHYPRILDVRWQPCDGLRPVRYDLKLCIADHEDGDFEELRIFEDIEEPYLCLSFVGDQPGRIYVRSKNAIGTSSWSEPVTFYWYSRNEG